MRPTLALGIALFLVLTSAPPAQAFVDPGTLPVLASGGGPGVGWASFKVINDGSPFSFEVHVENVSRVGRVALYLFDGSDTLLARGSLTMLLDSANAQYVDLHPAPGVDFHRDVHGASFQGGADILGVLNDPDDGPGVPGTYKVLAYAAGTASSWGFEVRGGSGTTLAGQLEGSATFLFTDRDFQGVANVAESSGGAGGQALVAVGRTVDVQRHLFGDFEESNAKFVCMGACVRAPSASVLQADTPEGNRVCSSRCEWAAAPPGAYAFSATLADVHPNRILVPCAPALGCPAAVVLLDDTLLAGGADADLPA